MVNFWQHIPNPAFSLAPMEDVTDTVSREIVLGMAVPGKLHVVFTEFTSVEGMNHPVGRERVSERLIVNESERELLKSKNIKLVAQIWGHNPEVYHKIYLNSFPGAAKLRADLMEVKDYEEVYRYF